MEHENIKKQNCCTAIIFGVVFGIIGALLWLFRLVTFIQYIIPYATADVLLIIALTTIIAIALKHSNIKHGCGGCSDVCIIITLIAASVFLIFDLIFVGSTMTYTMKIVLSFVGAISFATMLSTFLATVIRLVSRP